MALSALEDISLGYQLLWNRLRQLCGVQLFIQADKPATVDAPALMRALNDLWPEQAPVLLLSVPSSLLLGALLECTPAGNLWIEVNDTQLRDPALVRRVRQAHQRGLRLIWRGAPGARPSTMLATCFVRQMMTLSADEALMGLRVSMRQHLSTGTPLKHRFSSPVLAGQIYESMASRALADHCLDEQGVWAVAGWPLEDVLHGYRSRRIPPGQRTITQLREAIDADAPMETIEHLLSDDPLLAYRFMRYANSAGLGRLTQIESLRHALMVLGISRLRSWLLDQFPHASRDLNLQPIRIAMGVRARLMTYLLDSGGSEDLRREVFMCGLLSQIDLLLGEPLNEALARLPLPQRINAAILSHSGPYRPYLELAIALESPPTPATRELCATHQINTDAVNRALLRALSSTGARTTRKRLPA